MNKVTTAALAGLLAVTAGAQASQSRWNGFGSAKAYIADVQDIWTLPGVIASHPDTTYFEMGKTAVPAATQGTAVNAQVLSNQVAGGVHGKLGGGVLGLWFNTPSNTLSGIDNGFTAPTTTTGIGGPAFKANVIASLNNQLSVLYGFELSDATTLGFGLSRGVNSNNTETVTTTTSNTETNNNDLGINLGLEQKEVGPISLLEVGLQYNMRNNNSVVKNTTTNKLLADGSNITLRVGGDLAGENGAFGRFEVGFSTVGLTLKTEPSTAAAANTFIESKNGASAWNLGYAAGMSSDKGMGLMGIMLKNKGYDRTEAFNGGALFEVNKASGNTMNLLVTTAGEAKVNNWFSVRAGLESDIFFSNTTVTETGASGSTTKTTTSKNAHAGTVGDENAIASMGVTFTLGDLVLDGVLNQSLLYNGLYLVSGIPSGISSQVSLTWPWGGSKQ